MLEWQKLPQSSLQQSFYKRAAIWEFYAEPNEKESFAQGKSCGCEQKFTSALGVFLNHLDNKINEHILVEGL